MPTWDDVAAIGTRFPGVETSTSYGTPALKVKGKLMCRLRTDPDALAIRVLDIARCRGTACGASPTCFFTTPHYDGYPYVLVRLEAVGPGQLTELVEDAWRVRAPKRLVTEFGRRSGKLIPPTTVRSARWQHVTAAPSGAVTSRAAMAT